MQHSISCFQASSSPGDAILLACTHYPAIQAQILAHLKPETLLIDPAEHLTDWIIENWRFEQSDKPDSWFTSGDPAKLIENAHRAFGVKIKDPEQVHI